MYDVLIVRGAPGVGKSTLSKKLMGVFPNGVTIELGPMLKMIHEFKNGNSKQYSDTLENIGVITLNYLKQGYNPVLIIGPFKAARVKNHFLKVLNNDIKYLIISLLAEDDDLSHRIDQRTIGFKDKMVAYTVNDDIKNNTVANEIRINTSGKNPEQVFFEIKDSIIK